MKNYLFIVFLLTAFFGYSQPSEPTFVTIEKDLRMDRSETSLQQQQNFELSIVKAFKAGNAAKIAKYFSDNVDLSIDEKEDLYSKSQAEQILKSFFSAHKISDFKIVHKGSAGSSEYFIGELTADKVYKVTLNSKTVGGMKQITSLTITPN